MKRKIQLLGGIMVLAWPWAAPGQGTFQNLDFESAILPTLPGGQFGSPQPITLAMPSWTAYLGSIQISQVLHNNTTVGSPGISVLGPNWSFGGVLAGSYSVLLQAGRDPVNFPGQNIDATISQSGLIPAGSQSLRVWVQGNDFAMLFAGQNLPYYELASGAQHNVYGVDVSAYAGQSGELRFTSLSTVANPFNWVYVDAFSFSDQAVPEPSVTGILALAMIAMWFGRSSART